MINTLPIDCTIDSLTPYQIVVSNSPLLVPIGLAYKITVLGVPCPRAVYVTTMST